MEMEALMHMIAAGWPLGLAGFFFGALLGVMMSRGGVEGVALKPRLRSRDDGLTALAAELKAAKELLEAEEAEASEVAETLKSLDEAIKRANGRLKLITKAVNQAK